MICTRTLSIVLKFSKNPLWGCVIFFKKLIFWFQCHWVLFFIISFPLLAFALFCSLWLLWITLLCYEQSYAHFCFSSGQSLSRVQLSATPWTVACQASLSNSQSLLKLMSIESVMPSNHFILCCPLLLLPSVFPSIWLFSNESVLFIRWPKYWGFNFNISPSSEYSGLISFKMDWLDFLAVQGTLKCLLQHHSSKASIIWCSAFFMIHLSHPYTTTEKNHSFD